MMTASPTAEAASPLKLRDVTPILSIVATLEVAILTAAAYFGTHEEQGLLWLIIRKEAMVEWLTVLVLIPGGVTALAAYRMRDRFPARWLGVWMLLCALGLFYFAGEEASWGQHVFVWTPPEGVTDINRQNETNLHNLEVVGTMFGQKPKHVIEVWTVVGCIVMPLVLARRRPPLDPARDWAYWFWPTRACILAGVMCTLIYLPTRLARFYHESIPWELRWSEVQEFYFAWTLVLYVVSIYVRLGQMPRQTAA